MKKNAVAATNAIDISQKEIPTKSSDSRFEAARAKFGAAISAALAPMSFILP